ncbi:MAG: hypothetical protein WED33_06825 [Bacteroidia bacterium]
MIRLKAIILALIILLPTLLKAGVIANYWLQYDKYANELCENIDNSELECNGKCQMMEELNQTSTDSNPLSQIPELFKQKEQPANEVSLGLFILNIIESPISISAKGFPATKSGMKNDVFHPPCFFI